VGWGWVALFAETLDQWMQAGRKGLGQGGRSSLQSPHPCSANLTVRPTRAIAQRPTAPGPGVVSASTPGFSNHTRLLTFISASGTQVQKSWMYLEPIFSAGDIMKQLPQETRAFDQV